MRKRCWVTLNRWMVPLPLATFGKSETFSRLVGRLLLFLLLVETYICLPVEGFLESPTTPTKNSFEFPFNYLLKEEGQFSASWITRFHGCVCVFLIVVMCLGSFDVSLCDEAEKISPSSFFLFLFFILLKEKIV